MRTVCRTSDWSVDRACTLVGAIIFVPPANTGFITLDQSSNASIDQAIFAADNGGGTAEMVQAQSMDLNFPLSPGQKIVRSNVSCMVLFVKDA